MLPFGFGLAVGVGVLLCVGLLVLIALGLRRFLAGRSAGEDRHEEMEWDNSALTITINPITVVVAAEAEEDVQEEEATDDDEEENRTAVGVGLCEDEGDRPAKTRDLEWDNSTLPY